VAEGVDSIREMKFLELGHKCVLKGRGFSRAVKGA
jgi:hypothetical protein